MTYTDDMTHTDLWTVYARLTEGQLRPFDRVTLVEERDSLTCTVTFTLRGEKAGKVIAEASDSCVREHAPEEAVLRAMRRLIAIVPAAA